MLLQLRRIKKPEIKAKEQKKNKKKEEEISYTKTLVIGILFFLMQGNRTLDPFLTFLSSNYSGNAVFILYLYHLQWH